MGNVGWHRKGTEKRSISTIKCRFFLVKAFFPKTLNIKRWQAVNARGNCQDKTDEYSVFDNSAPVVCPSCPSPTDGPDSPALGGETRASCDGSPAAELWSGRQHPGQPGNHGPDVRIWEGPHAHREAAAGEEPVRPHPDWQGDSAAKLCVRCNHRQCATCDAGRVSSRPRYRMFAVIKPKESQLIG